MLQLESVSHVYSFHSYAKNLVTIIVPHHLRQQTEAEKQRSDQGFRKHDSNQEFSLMDLRTTTLIYQDKLKMSHFPDNFSGFDQQCLEHLLQYPAEIYLVGTGESSKFPERSIHRQIHTRKLAIDFMDTGAACRTYNILTGEGRNVAVLVFLDKEKSDEHRQRDF